MNWEFDILDYIQNIRTDELDFIIPLITKLANGGIIWIVLCIALLIFPKTRRAGVLVAIALVTESIVCNLLIKPIVARTRPYDINTSVKLLIGRQIDYSFPSGHTSASFAVAFALLAAKQKKLFVMTLILSVLIAFTRLYLYVHFPTDIFAGMIIGIVFGILSAPIYEFITKKYNSKKGLQK